MSKEKNVFISHHSEDEENIGKMKDLLSPHGYELKNSSIDSTKPNEANNPDYIKRLLRERINWAGTFVCLIGPDTHTREWVNWEIDEAHRLGKRIVGIFINGGRDSDVPESLERYGDSLEGWTSEKIIDAIEGKTSNWETTDGTPRKSKWDTERDIC